MAEPYVFKYRIKAEFGHEISATLKEKLFPPDDVGGFSSSQPYDTLVALEGFYVFLGYILKPTSSRWVLLRKPRAIRHPSQPSDSCRSRLKGCRLGRSNSRRHKVHKLLDLACGRQSKQRRQTAGAGRCGEHHVAATRLRLTGKGFLDRQSKVC